MTKRQTYLTSMLGLIALPISVKSQITAFASGKNKPSVQEVNNLYSSNHGNISLEMPQIGEVIPDLKLTEVHHNLRKSISLGDFRGKWLIIDFWNQNCVSCIESFPKLNLLNKKFKDKIQFLLIGDNSVKYNKKIREVYERFRVKFELDLSVAYDSTLIDLFSVRSFPLTIIIDEKGIIRHITYTGPLFNESNLLKLIEGKYPTFDKIVGLNNFSRNKPESIESKQRIRNSLIGKNNTDSPFLFRSILSKWDESMPIRINPITTDLDYYPNSYHTMGVPLFGLYNLAYNGTYLIKYQDSLYGKVALFPIIKSKDSLEFGMKVENSENKIAYNYGLNTPQNKLSKDIVMKIMQRELNSYFGYKATFEFQKMPYWKLVATPKAKKNLISNAIPDSLDQKKLFVFFSHIGFEVKNKPINLVLNLLSNYNYFKNGIPFLDETGITKNIDLRIDAVLNDINDVRKELQKNGLDLILSEKQMKVLTISD